MIQIVYKWLLFHLDNGQNNDSNGEPNIIDEGTFATDEDEQGDNEVNDPGKQNLWCNSCSKKKFCTGCFQIKIWKKSLK